MLSKKRLSAAALAVLVFLPVSAQAQERGAFWGLDVSAGTASGSSKTRDGGAAFAGGGVVRDVKFGSTTGLGAQLGYRFDSNVSAFVSYQHVRGKVSWSADFPLFGVASGFAGNATTDALLANVAYRWPVSEATSINARLGLGFAANTLSGVVETDVASGLFLSDVAKHTKTNPMALIGVGVQHRIAQNTLLGVALSVAHTGGFQTGSTRSGNLGITPITPYKIDKVWRTGLEASIRVAF